MQAAERHGNEHTITNTLQLFNVMPPRGAWAKPSRGSMIAHAISVVNSWPTDQNAAMTMIYGP